MLPVRLGQYLGTAELPDNIVQYVPNAATRQDCWHTKEGFLTVSICET
jgi:hypothetical protein